MAADPRYHECDACDYQVGGYSKNDLLAKGWKWMAAGKGREFVMCDECIEDYEQCWAAC
jgi:hypothetical protein